VSHGGAYPSVNANCLDGADLSGVQVTYLDGLHPRPEVRAGHARAAAATDSRGADENLEGADAEVRVPGAVSATEGRAATTEGNE